MLGVIILVIAFLIGWNMKPQDRMGLYAVNALDDVIDHLIAKGK